MYSKYKNEDRLTMNRMKDNLKNEILSPSFIKTIYTNNPIVLETMYIKIKGICEYSNITIGKLYCFNIYLKDEVTGDKISLWIPKNLIDNIESGCLYEFDGYFNRKLDYNPLSIKINFTVKNILNTYDSTNIDIKEKNNKNKLIELKNKRINRPYNDIAYLIKNMIENNKNPVNITILTGNTSKILNDIYNEITFKDYYIFNEVRVNLNDIDDIVKSIQSIDTSKVDILVLARGGGDDNSLDIFNNLDILEELINLKIPFVSAIGHYSDINLVQDFADKAFSTPTSLGAWLNNVVKKSLELINKFNEMERSLKEKELYIEKLNNKIKEQNTKDNNEVINEVNTTIEQLKNNLNDKEITSTSSNSSKVNYYIIVLILIFGIIIGKLIF